MTENRLQGMFLTADDLAQRWQIPRSTLHYWRKVGGGPKFTLIGKYPRYRYSDVEAYERAREAS